MRIREKKTRVIEYEATKQVLCDWCKRDMTREDENANLGRKTREFRLEYSVGFGGCDGGSQEGWEVSDLCDDCVNRLWKLLVDAGIYVAETELDW